MSRSWEAKSLAIVALSTLKAGLRGETRLLGIDLGAKTIGLALSDVSRMVATPYRTLDRNKFSRNARELETVIDEQDVGGVVLGWPVEMDGGEGSRCRATRRFAENLIERRDIPIAFWDERLSTAAGSAAGHGSRHDPETPQGSHRQNGGGLHPSRRPGRDLR